MKRSSLFVIAALLLVSACSSSHRPVYSGREESTAGVPGFVDGKKVSPHVKLGQSYTVDGETYVPRNQPDYVEEGMASWYGPGFHGGKTANGEIFDAAELTAAHRTLPLPSIVRVTMVSTGKQVYVRINDRGPFAHSRIIDLSRGAAQKIGLLQAGVGKVRVEYMKAESERFTELLAQGRTPKSIDLASEVLNFRPSVKPTEYARGDVRTSEPATAAQMAEARKPSTWESLNPIRSANAAEPQVTVEQHAAEEVEPGAAPIADVSSSDLPQKIEEKPLEPKDDSPFTMVETPQAAPPPRDPVAAASAPTSSEPLPSAPGPVQPVIKPGYYVQLGAFLKMENAQKVQAKFKPLDAVEIISKSNAKGQTLFHVRMGRYSSQQEGSLALEKVKTAGAQDARVIHE